MIQISILVGKEVCSVSFITTYIDFVTSLNDNDCLLIQQFDIAECDYV